MQACYVYMCFTLISTLSTITLYKVLTLRHSVLYFAAKNRTLTHLDLSWNNIQLKGSVALLTRMEASVSKLI